MNNQPIEQPKKSLDFNKEIFEQLLKKCQSYILERFENLSESKVFSGLTPSDIQEWLNEPLPTAGMNPFELLSYVKEKVMDTATLNLGPNMYAYVMAGGTQISILAESIVSTINQNVGKWHLAPVMSEMEKQVIQWTNEFIDYPRDSGGVLVSGGSAANLTALTVAKNVFFEHHSIKEKGLFGLSPFTVYASIETHNCIDKSIDTLGIGLNQYRKIPVRDDFTIDLSILEQQIMEDKKNGFTPFCVIANAGTVNTGAIDPFLALGNIAKKHHLWFHIDGAYGMLAAVSDKLKPLYKGISMADSVALDFHKWLYQPFEAGCTLVRNWKWLPKTYYKKASYLYSHPSFDGRLDFNEYQFQLSRSAKALKVWMTFKVYGSSLIKKMIEKDIQMAQYLSEKIIHATDFELCSQPILGIICFRYVGNAVVLNENQLNELNQRIILSLEADGRVFITGTRLKTQNVIRACIINHRIQKNNIDKLINVIREMGEKELKQW